MSEKPGPILVAGARGNQGGAVVRHLLAQPSWLFRSMGDFGRFATSIPALSSHVDIASLRASYPGLRKLEEALRAARPMHYPPK